MGLFARIRNLCAVIRDGFKAVHEVRQMMKDWAPVLHQLQPFINDMGPLIQDMAPLIRDMKPVIEDIQKISHDTQPVIHDVQTQFRGPDLTGWEQLGADANGIKLTVVDALAHLKTHVGSPAPNANPDSQNLFAMLATIANVLAPIANILPHPFGDEPKSPHQHLLEQQLNNEHLG